jgi:hypothetical protein
VITQLDHEGFPVAVVCQALGVSRAGYYAHVRGEAGPREQEDARLRPLVRQIFWEHKRRYGARRIAAELAARGEACGPGRVARLLKQLGANRQYIANLFPTADRLVLIGSGRHYIA